LKLSRQRIDVDLRIRESCQILVGVAAVVLLMTLLDRQLPRRPMALSSPTPPPPDTKGNGPAAATDTATKVRT